jgi:DNA-binding MarR family transcriptional regulator
VINSYNPYNPVGIIMDKKERLPEELFEVLSMLYPAFAQLLDEYDLSLAEISLLSYIKHRGKKRSDGQALILRSQLGGALERLISEATVSNRIKKLVNRRLIMKVYLTASEKRELYGTDAGTAAALVLLEEGSKRVEEFNNGMNRIFQEATLNTPPPIIRALLAMIRGTARKIMDSKQNKRNSKKE